MVPPAIAPSLCKLPDPTYPIWDADFSLMLRRFGFGAKLGRQLRGFCVHREGQVVVAAGLEQSARSQIILRLAILAGEPASGSRGAMGEAGHGRIGSLLAEIVRRGVAILLIEQKLAIALKITHRLYVIADRTVNGNVDIDILARQCDPG